jgi:hypothetical protein
MRNHIKRDVVQRYACHPERGTRKTFPTRFFGARAGAESKDPYSCLVLDASRLALCYFRASSFAFASAGAITVSPS